MVTTYRSALTACVLAALCAACATVPAGALTDSVSGQRLAVAGHELVVDVFLPAHLRDLAPAVPSRDPSRSPHAAPSPRAAPSTHSGPSPHSAPRPDSAPPTGAVILAHGFTRSRTTMNGHAAALAADGALALTVDMPCTFDFECNARALSALAATLRAGGLVLRAALVGPSVGATVGALVDASVGMSVDAATAVPVGAPVGSPVGTPSGVTIGVPVGAVGRESGAPLPPVDRIVLVGFSAGALSSLLAAGTPGVVGYVGLDPFDRTRPDGQVALGMTVAPTLRTPAVLVRAEPSRCNAQAVAAPWAGALPALQSDTVIAAASHCDFESPSDWICGMACGPADAQRQQQVQALLRQAVRGWLGPR